MRGLAAAFLLLQLLGACGTVPSPQQRLTHANVLAASGGWESNRISAGRFELVAYTPVSIRQDDMLTVYIEGDGFAWLSASQPSLDPTPRDPLALRLALAHPEGNVAYLARPCQFVDATRTRCPQRYWTDARFAREVIDASSEAIDEVMGRFGATRLILVGFSGGAAVAALLTVNRQDVERLVTVGGNLDHQAWTEFHRVHPLSGSLNPADHIEELESVPQWHFVGGEDDVMPPALVRAFVSRFSSPQIARTHVEPEFDHHCCWVEHWPRLLSESGMR